MQETQVRSPIWEDLTCCEAPKPAKHLSLCTTTIEPEEIIATQPLNFVTEIRAFFEAFCGENADEAKKRADWKTRPDLF